jgi:hypothetical protein
MILRLNGPLAKVNTINLGVTNTPFPQGRLIALRHKSVSDRGFVSTVSHILSRYPVRFPCRSKVAPLRSWKWYVFVSARFSCRPIISSFVSPLFRFEHLSSGNTARRHVYRSVPIFWKLLFPRRRSKTVPESYRSGPVERSIKNMA